MAAKINIQLTKQQQQMLALGVVVLGVGGFLYIKQFWIPTSVRIDAAKKQIADLEGKINTAKAQAARRPQIEKQLALLQQQATEAEKRLPKERDVTNVIETLNGLARQYQIEIQSWTPGKDAPKQYFIEIPYSMSVQGGYHNLGRFLAAIALKEQIFNVRDVTFSGGGGAAAANLNVSFTFVAYQYRG